jgi:hypothetical protein
MTADAKENLDISSNEIEDSKTASGLLAMKLAFGHKEEMK